MVCRVAVLVVVGGLMVMTVACGNGKPASPTATQTKAFDLEKTTTPTRQIGGPTDTINGVSIPGSARVYFARARAGLVRLGRETSAKGKARLSLGLVPLIPSAAI